LTVTSGRSSGRLAPKVSRDRQRGGAVAELAIAMPFIFMMMLGAVDFGRMLTVSTRVADATYAAAAYGAQSTSTAQDTNGMRNVALHELGLDVSASTTTKTGLVVGDASALTATAHATASTKDYDIAATRYCECEDHKSVDCDTGACAAGSGNRRVYVRVRVGTTFLTVFDYPGIPHEVTITRQTEMRAR